MASVVVPQSVLVCEGAGTRVCVCVRTFICVSVSISTCARAFYGHAHVLWSVLCFFVVFFPAKLLSF